MKKELKIGSIVMLCFFLICISGLMVFCDHEDTVLAPYKGSPSMSQFIIESQTLTPKFTWLGGYVSTFGVNRGSEARLDSSLQWLIHTDDNNLHFPIKYGEPPSGATDLTTQYGGHFEDFIEDNTYTFWMVKTAVWDAVVANAGKTIIQTESDSIDTQIAGDSLLIDHHYHLQKTSWIDAYINVDMESIKGRGGLATITLIETDTSNSPAITWEIIDSDVTDTLLAAVGLCEGASYNPRMVIWEAWSVDTSGGLNVYGTKNVIPQPVVIGQPIPGTRVFEEYPADGLSPNKTYLFWIASEGWDCENHLRFTKYHAYITFETWRTY